MSEIYESQESEQMPRTTVIYEGTPGPRLRTEHIEVIGIAGDGLEEALHHALEAGDVGRIELCGGMGVAQAAQAHDVVADRVQVGLLRYAFESLELIAHYKGAFAAGDARPGLGAATAAAVLRGAKDSVPVGFVEP